VGSHPAQIGRQRRGASPKNAFRHAYNNFRFNSTPDLAVQLKYFRPRSIGMSVIRVEFVPEQFESPNGYSRTGLMSEP
jgi:hypothetical protein